MISSLIQICFLTEAIVPDCSFAASKYSQGTSFNLLFTDKYGKSTPTDPDEVAPLHVQCSVTR